MGALIFLVQKDFLELPDQGDDLQHHLSQAQSHLFPFGLKALIEALELVAFLGKLRHKVSLLGAVGEHTRL